MARSSQGLIIPEHVYGCYEIMEIWGNRAQIPLNHV